jgi:hypothetical protein
LHEIAIATVLVFWKKMVEKRAGNTSSIMDFGTPLKTLIPVTALHH